MEAWFVALDPDLKTTFIGDNVIELGWMKKIYEMLKS